MLFYVWINKTGVEVRISLILSAKPELHYFSTRWSEFFHFRHIPTCHDLGSYSIEFADPENMGVEPEISLGVFYPPVTKMGCKKVTF